jgi:nucleotide-binding universal stress UspA family protein
VILRRSGPRTSTLNRVMKILVATDFSAAAATAAGTAALLAQRLGGQVTLVRAV